MGDTVTGRFESRREAELAVEHLVQEHGVERTDIFIEPESNANSAGVVEAGADAESGHPGFDKNSEPALEGAIIVSVDVNDDQVDVVRDVMTEAGGEISSD